jgi:ABC-type sugar transport system permease subunit
MKGTAAGIFFRGGGSWRGTAVFTEEKMKRYVLPVLAYLVPTFALGFVWHLILFEGYYKALQIYRESIIVPFGFVSMLIQAAIFAYIFDRAFAGSSDGWLSRGLRYAALGALLSWSFTTIAVAAKNVMTSVPDYLVIETAFTVVQWLMVGPLTALAFETARGTKPALS